jgi:aryl-alcohol dehydrogenase-like predicted oxidoreductase
MEMRPLGRTDISVSALCLGTMMYGDQISEKDAFEQMDVSFERGINFFDTAELYTIPPKPETHGNSERIVGQWLKERGRRSDVILATKVTGRSSLTHLREPGVQPRLTREQIIKACDDSLARLQTDYIDLYQTHWPDRKAPVFGTDISGYRHYDDDYVPYEDILETMQELVKAGKIRHFGLSNETSYGTMRHLQAAEEKGLPRAVSIQNAYNLVNRMFEYGLAEIAMEEQVGLLAYSPIGQGALSGKYLDGAKPAGSRGQLYGRLDRYENPGVDPAIKSYVALAKDWNIDPSALAMQFVTTRPWVTSNIFGASSMAQLDVIFQSLEIDWTRELDKAVNDIHRRCPSPSM